MYTDESFIHVIVFPGAILLDLEAEDLPTIVNQIVEQLVITDQLDPEDKGKVIKSLLLKHK